MDFVWFWSHETTERKPYQVLNLEYKILWSMNNSNVRYFIDNLMYQTRWKKLNKKMLDIFFGIFDCQNVNR